MFRQGALFLAVSRAPLGSSSLESTAAKTVSGARDGFYSVSGRGAASSRMLFTRTRVFFTGEILLSPRPCLRSFSSVAEYIRGIFELLFLELLAVFEVHRSVREEYIAQSDVRWGGSHAHAKPPPDNRISRIGQQMGAGARFPSSQAAPRATDYRQSLPDPAKPARFLGEIANDICNRGGMREPKIYAQRKFAAFN